MNLKNYSNLPQEQRIRISFLLNEYKYRWSIHAREKQRLPLGDWTYWLIKAGRGFGKTRTGAETVRSWKNDYPIINLIGATAADVRDIMVEGESGILNISPKWDKPHYEPSKKKLTWNNGAIGKLFSADEPDRVARREEGLCRRQGHRACRARSGPRYRERRIRRDRRSVRLRQDHAAESHRRP